MSPVSMSWGEFIAGLVALGAVAGSVGIGAAILVRARLAHLGGVPALLAWVTYATTGAIAVHLVPLALGILSPWSVLATAVVALLASIALAGRRAPATYAADGRPSDEPGPGLERAAALASVSVALGAIIAAAARLIDAPVSELDMLTWNLPQIATWIQDGNLWQIHESVPYWGHDNYPHNGDILLLGLLLPWDNDFLARTLAYPFLGVAGLAVAQLAREVGARREVAVTCAALLLAIPSVTLPAVVNVMPDVVLVAMFATGLVFLVRYDRSGARSELVVAGLALGIAFGTKWYGVTAVAATMVAWFAGHALWRVRARLPYADGAMLAGLIALTGGLWLVRNLVLYANPVYPASVGPLFDAPRDVIRELYGHSLLDYAGDGRAWTDHVLPAFGTMFGAAGVAVAAAAAIVAAGALRRRVAEDRTAVLLLALAVVVACVYAVTPYSALGLEGDPFNVEANTRYAVPALIAAAGTAAVLSPRWSVVLLMAAPVAVASTVTGRDLAPAWQVAAASVAVAGVLLVLPRLKAPSRAVGRAEAAAIALAAAAVLGAAALVLERRFNDTRYGFTDPALAAIEASPAGSRVAVTGAWDDSGPAPVFPAFGARLRNEVEYLGVLVDGQLRPPATERRWHRLLATGGYDLLLVGLADPVVAGPPVRAWAARARLPVLARSGRFVLYRPGTVRSGA